MRGPEAAAVPPPQAVLLAALLSARSGWPAEADWSACRQEQLRNPGYTLLGTACVPCDVGFYKTYHGNTGCSACPSDATSTQGSDELVDCQCNPGFTGSNGGSCAACNTGKYKITIGPAICTDCPTGATSAQGSDALEDCKCNLGFTGPNGIPCSACVSGKYKDTIGSVVCTSCPTNATSAEGSDALNDCQCNAGFTGANGGTCTDCGTGTYKDSIGSATSDDDKQQMQHHYVFNNSAPVMSYSVDEVPSSFTEETLWSTCMDLLSTPFFTLPVRPTTGNDTSLHVDADMRYDPATETSTSYLHGMERAIEKILERARDDSPVFWTKVHRYVPSDSAWCEDLQASPTPTTTSRANILDLRDQEEAPLGSAAAHLER